MPKANAHQPAVPQVSTDTWKTLLAADDEFHRLAPWEWMHDSHVIGMRHPITKEVLLGSILGRLRQVFGLLVYRNDAGRRWLLNTILNDGDSGGFEREDTAFEQDLVKAEFVLKRELVKEDQAVLAASGYSPVDKHGHVWPQFRSLAPGRVSVACDAGRSGTAAVCVAARGGGRAAHAGSAPRLGRSLRWRNRLHPG